MQLWNTRVIGLEWLEVDSSNISVGWSEKVFIKWHLNKLKKNEEQITSNQQLPVFITFTLELIFFGNIEII